MIRFTAAALVLALATPALAQSAKEKDCRYQADVAAAVAKARVDGVKERKVAETIAASNPGWPERYNKAIPLLSAQFYQTKKKDLEGLDMGKTYFEACMAR